jgi:predicted acylesterase/phospholipase RssA
MKYIDNLCENYKNINKTIDIDIIIEGGLFNGLYTAGSLFLIKKLEKKNYLRVNRISGASIGAILGFYYFCDILHEFPNDFLTIRDHFKKDLNLAKIEDIANEKIKNITKQKVDNLNSKLFITYVKNGEQITKNNYENKTDLKEALLKSIQIPYFTTNTFFRKYKNDNYLDGGVPFIFNEREFCENKYILYLNNSNIKTMFSIKNEQNAHSRILEGALDAHNFFFA